MDADNSFALDFTVLDDDEIGLLKSLTGITGIKDMEKLKKHVEDVVERAHKVLTYHPSVELFCPQIV